MMLKKRIISFLLVLSVFAMIPIHAEAISDEEVKAPAAILMEASTGKVLYEKNPDEKSTRNAQRQYGNCRKHRGISGISECRTL